ncbi:MAG: oligopeptide/dipeptide ABC transporter ATP-binding protein [Pseudomonadota bacterium]
MSLLTIRDLSSEPGDYGEAGLNGLDLTLEPGGRLALIGEHGSGLLSLPALLQGTPEAGKRITSGEIRFESQETGPATPAKINRQGLRGLTCLPRDLGAGFDPQRRIGPQMVLAIRRRCRMSARDAERTALNLLDRYGVANPAHVCERRPEQLDPAEIWRAGLAIALASEPILLIAAPFTGLDTVRLASIWALIGRQCMDHGTALLLLTPNLAEAAEMAELGAVLYAGRVIEEGAVRDLIDHPRHPYTAALAAAMPERARLGQSLPELPGSAPNGQTLPRGCAFHPRCASALAGCYLEMPEMTREQSHRYACFWPQGQE